MEESTKIMDEIAKMEALIQRYSPQDQSGGGGGIEKMEALIDQHLQEDIAFRNQPWAVRNIADPFNRAWVDLGDLPYAATNAALGAMGTDKRITTVKESLQSSGFMAPEGQEEEGFFSRMMYLTPLVVAGEAALIRYGARYAAGSLSLTNESSGAISNAIRTAAKHTAEKPLQSSAIAGVSTAGAAGAHTVASEHIDSPAWIAVWEMIGAFTAPVAAWGLTMPLLRTVMGKISEHVTPFLKGGAEMRAAKRLQEGVGDKDAALSGVETYGGPIEGVPGSRGLPVGRASDDEFLRALENRLLSKDPEIAAAASKDLDAEIDRIFSAMGNFDGNTATVRELLEGHRDHILRTLELKAQHAGKQSAEDMEGLFNNPDIDVNNIRTREISVVAAKSLDDAYKTARATERRMWRALEDSPTYMNTPVEVTHGTATVRGLRADIAKTEKEDLIPDYILKWLDPDAVPPEVKAQLEKAGFLDSDGNVPEALLAQMIDEGAITPVELSFRDVSRLRSRILTDIRHIRAQPGHDRNQVRILKEIANGNPETGAKGLVDDLDQANLEGARTAAEYSRRLNEMFTQGAVGQLLRFEKTGARSFDPADTLSAIVFGNKRATNIKSLIDAQPNVQPEIEDFITAKYVQAAMENGVINQGRHDRFIRQLVNNEVDQVLPKLIEKFELAKRSADVAKAMQDNLAAGYVPENGGKSVASLYLNAPVGQEIEGILTGATTNLFAEGAALRSMMNGDELAIQGLKTEYVEYLLKTATMNAGVRVTPSGTTEQVFDLRVVNNLIKNMHGNQKFEQGLGFTADESKRIRIMAEALRRATTPLKGEEHLYRDMPAALVQVMARISGATMGGRAGSGPGTPLVLAHEGSKRMQRVISGLTQSRARNLLSEAMQDRELFQALMGKRSAALPEQIRNANIIAGWVRKQTSVTLPVLAAQSQDIAGAGPGWSARPDQAQQEVAIN